MAQGLAKRCPCHGQTLDRLVQPALLAFLAREPGNGYRLLRELAQLPMFRDNPPNVAGVYRHLKDMERRGLLRGSWKLSTAGPASRRFRLTPAGRTCLRAWARTLDDYVRDLARMRTLLGRSARLRR